MQEGASHICSTAMATRDLQNADAISGHASPLPITREDLSYKREESLLHQMPQMYVPKTPRERHGVLG